MNSNNDFKKRLIHLSRNNRQKQTDAERILWRLLRGRRFEGFKFRRQHVIDGYIVDFACIEHKLIVELDGYHHEIEDIAQYDAKRTSCLRTQGFKVVRFWNTDVYYDRDSVTNMILAILKGEIPGE